MSFSLQAFSNESYSKHAEAIRAHGESIFRGGYKSIVFTNGCFDIMHPGHIQVLASCRDAAGPYGAVVVGLNDDNCVKRLKGDDRPIFDLAARSMMLLSTRFVDHIISFEEDTPIDLIEALRPNLIVKGGDYASDIVVGHDVAPVEIAALDENWSTSKIILKIKGETCSTSLSRVI